MKNEIADLLAKISTLHKQSKLEKNQGTTSSMYVNSSLVSHKKLLEELVKKSVTNWETVYKGLLEQIGIVEEKKEGLTPKKIVTRRDEVVDNNKRLQEWQEKNRQERGKYVPPVMESFEND